MARGVGPGQQVCGGCVVQQGNQQCGHVLWNQILLVPAQLVSLLVASSVTVSVTPAVKEGWF